MNNYQRKYFEEPIQIDMEAIMKAYPVSKPFVIIRILSSILKFATNDFFVALGRPLAKFLSLAFMIFGLFKLFNIILDLPNLPSQMYNDVSKLLNETYYNEKSWTYWIRNISKTIFDFVFNILKTCFNFAVNFFKKMYYDSFEKITIPETLDSYPGIFFPNATYCDAPRDDYLNVYSEKRCDKIVFNINGVDEGINTNNIDTNEYTDINVTDTNEYINKNIADSNEYTDTNSLNNEDYLYETLINDLKLVYFYKTPILIGLIILIILGFLISKRKSIVKRISLAKKMAETLMNKNDLKIQYFKEATWFSFFTASLFYILIAEICKNYDFKIPQKIAKLIKKSDSIFYIAGYDSDKRGDFHSFDEITDFDEI